MPVPQQQPLTIGMRLDAVVSRIDSLPPTQLYGIIVMASVIFSFILLNSGGGPRPSTSAPSNINSPSRTIKIRRRSSANRKNDGPEPKWHILKVLNYAAVFSFVASVAKFASDASAYLNDSTSLLTFLTVWSAFLCYFFGFFGISFVDADDIMAEQREEEEAAAAAQKTAAGGKQPQLVDIGVVDIKKSSRSAATSLDSDHVMGATTSSSSHGTKKPLHPPAPAAPVCSDPASFNISSPSTPANLKNMSDNEITKLVLTNRIKDHQLEKLLDPHRAVSIRRLAFDIKLASLNSGGALDELPYEASLDYGRVFGVNCEIVVGYIPIPVGMVGPLTLNNETVYVPMATTEGCLVASTNRGAKAISQGGGAVSTIVRDGITRAPCVRMGSAREAAELKLWCEEPKNFALLKKEFESTTSFGKLLSCDPTVAGKNVYLRLCCFSGDAMGMNMVSKGSLAVIDFLKSMFPTLSLVALSGNMCTDKKAAAINWIEGRGKSVVVEATIPKEVVRSTLKTTVEAIVATNVNKNLIGSAMAGTIGGFNAHAANIVTAVFLATGQDPAQNVESSNCITLMEETEDGDLWISCTMPSIEVGTVGGGTGLPAQAACLKAIGCKGGGEKAGDNARQLAHVVAAATMAGELSLLAALAANTLVQAHMAHNRKPAGK